MRSLKKMNELADRFEIKIYKYAQAPQTFQYGTAELFFGSEDKLKEFGRIIQDPNGSLSKILTENYNKLQSKVAFDLKINATPKKGAKWILNTTPASIKEIIINALNKEFQKIIGQSMTSKLKEADVKAKEGYGSDQLDVGALDLS